MNNQKDEQAREQTDLRMNADSNLQAELLFVTWISPYTSATR